MLLRALAAHDTTFARGALDFGMAIIGRLFRLHAARL